MTQAPSDAGKMSLWEHLDELRVRLVRAIIAYIIGASVAWTYRDPILAWLWKPFADSWRAAKIPGDPALNFAAPSDAFKAVPQAVADRRAACSRRRSSSTSSGRSSRRASTRKRRRSSSPSSSSRRCSSSAAGSSAGASRSR